jgi:hypothetical protein
MDFIGPETVSFTAKIESPWPWKKIMGIFPSPLTANLGLRYKEVSLVSLRSEIHTTAFDACHVCMGIALISSSYEGGHE